MLKTLAGHVGPVLSMAITPDGVTAYSGGQDKTIRAWNLADGKLLRTLCRPAPVTAIAIVPGGQSLLTGGSDGTVRWLDAADGRERMSRKWHNGAVLDLAAFVDSPSTTVRIVSVAEDGTARVGTLNVQRLGGTSATRAGWSQGRSPSVGHHFRWPDDCHRRGRRDRQIVGRT